MNLPIKLKEFITWAKNNKKKFYSSLLIAFVLAIGLSGLAVYFLNKDLFLKIIKTSPRYAQGYILVDDKISQGANIAINVPSFTTKEEMKAGLKFDPVIKGVLSDTADAKKIVFQPTEKLTPGNYYTVMASTSQGVIGKDFQIVAPPQIEAVFPKADSETNEKSNITIIFSRPMVALTTLDELADKDIPVVITPETKGKFKWIGTKTLQFIPQDTLIPSSNYLVSIYPGFVSVEGLAIDGAEQKFITRPLRYESIEKNGIVRYNEPFKIYFNQAVDLNKTAAEITITSTSTNSSIAFTAEYGKKENYDKDLKKFVETIDESVISIFNKEDKYGRQKFWNFNESFRFKINKAYPKKGDIILNEPRETDFQITGIIAGISAESDKSDLASTELFDPAGKLVVSFYENIDKDKSKITSDKITNIVYGEKCQEGVEFADATQCEKETDKKVLIMSFAPSKIGKGEKIEIGFDKIYNSGGLLINAEPVKQTVTSYPELKILQTIPKSGATGADLNKIVICANSPVAQPAGQDLLKKNISQYIESNLDFEISSWYRAYFVAYKDLNYIGCNIGQYETQLYVGLMPEENYKLDFKLEDDFGQAQELTLAFRTGKMPDQKMNFYHFQDQYNVTKPGKTKMTFAAFNMEFVDMTICQLKAEDALFYLNNWIDYKDGPGTINNCTKTVTKRIDLPKKYWLKNYFQVDLKDHFPNTLGHFMFTFTNPRYFDWSGKNQVYERAYLTITNLSIVEKKLQLFNDQDVIDRGENLKSNQLAKTKDIYWITKIDSLQSVAGAELEFYSTDFDDKIKVSRAKTDSNGIAEILPVDRLAGIVARSGNDSAIMNNWRSNLDSGSNAYSAQMMYVYTDRPIYRPSQTVYFKGIYRIGFDGDYEIFREKKIPVKVYNANNDVIFDKELDINDFGTFNGEFILDGRAPLGSYRIDAKGSSGFFDVEEYVPAAFKVEARTDKEEYVSQESFNLDIDANYYFGAPVEGGTVEYSIASQNYYFDKYQDEYFDFGNPWYYCGYGCSYGDEFVLRNTATLDERGKGRINQALDFKNLFKPENRNSKIFIVYITVKNSSGQAVSTQKSFIVHAGDFYLGLKADKSFLGINEKFNLKMKSVDTQGLSMAADNIKVKIDKVTWVYAKRKEVDGGFYYTYEKKLEPVSEKTVSTDSNGNWNSEFSLDKEGEYEVSAVAADKKGNEIKTIYDLYVYGEGQVEVRPSNDQTLEVITDKNNLEVGDTANIIIKSPFARAKALISIDRGKIFHYDIVDINQNIYEYKFLIKEEYIPSINASVVLLSAAPEVKFGYTSFSVNTKEKNLTITATPNKETYVPGEDVVINYLVEDSANRPVETELSTAVVDLSVLALKGNPKKDPVSFFYGYFPLSIRTASNIKNILYETDLPVIGGKGGGGAEPDDLAKKKRGIFKDTAFWQAVIKTGKDGRAESKFTLPDNLTTWQIESLGVTTDTRLGVVYQEFMAKKDVMVVPLVPRFILPGDEFAVGGKIFNQTKDSQRLAVSFESGTLMLNDDKIKNIKLDANQTINIYFKVISPEAMQSGNHTFVISAKNEKYEDSVEGNVKINRNNTYETVATADNSTAASTKEYIYLPGNIIKDQGGLTINTSATLAVYLSDALNYLLEYPYGCSEQIASKLNAIAAVKKGLALENIGDKINLKEIEMNGQKYSQEAAVEIGLNEIYKNYLPGQGFTYYPGGLPNFYLTLYLADVLNNLKAAGFAVRADIYDSLPGIIQQNFLFMPDNQKDDNLLILTAFMLSKFSNFKLNATIISNIKNLEKNDPFLNEKASNIALVNLVILLNEKKYDFNSKYKEKIYKILENRIDIDARGAFLKPNGNLIWQYYESPTKDTAIFLKALVKGKRENEVTDRLLRWLLNSRSKDGAWETTNNTISVIDAMADYLNWKQENKSDFALMTSLNGSVRSSLSYGPENILAQDSNLIPVKELNFEAMNTLDFAKTNRNNTANNFYYDISLKYYLPVDQISPRDEGFYIKRTFYARDDTDNKTPITEAKVGDVLKGHLEIMASKSRNFVAIEDFIPAGVELVNFNLATADQSLTLDQQQNNTNQFDQYGYGYGYYPDDGKFHPDKQELRDDRLFMFKERLDQGTYTFDYFVRALVPGKFHHLPAVASEMYFSENFGRTGGKYFVVKEK